MLVSDNTTPASSSPCLGCPWRTENHGKRHPDGWYSKANLRRLWAGMRRGEQMSCHPTDASNPVSEAAQEKGYRPAPERAQLRECAGAVIMTQRELMVFQDHVEAGGGFKAYRADRGSRAMTLDGLRRLVDRAVFTRGYVTPDLNQPVSLPDDDLPWPHKLTRPGTHVVTSRPVA
jgi:hypothetical protein